MKKSYKRGQEIRKFILKNISTNPQHIVNQTSEYFNISRQAVNRYIQDLLKEGQISATGNTRQRIYSLKVLHKSNFSIPLIDLKEDVLWRAKIAELFQNFPSNVINIWHYSFTEMVNNAIDHSAGTKIVISIEMNSFLAKISIHDNGVGIFKKIKKECNLEDERHAVLELAKGKLTTDSENHTGEGVFFTSRMLDDFAILSGEVFFSHKLGADEDWIMERETPDTGTSVFMSLANQSTRTDKDVFDRFASEEEDYGFTKTIVPVRLVRHGAEKLISRSQAKRLLGRIDRFKTVILDFQEIDSIGRAFADEIFRVFEKNHPNILLIPINTIENVKKMITAIKTEI
ncbi:MAG: DUF4325 domain-containing protein [Candidatus Omnitrophica bacterium]|nr:DUF4325 domain-containing protein [Candidatus Omnitrophota bacterium]